MADSVQGLREVVVFSQDGRRLQEIHDKSDALTGLQVRYGKQLGFQQGAIEGLQAVGALVVLMLGAYLVGVGGLSAAALPVATMLALTCFTPVAEIARIVKELANAFGSGRRVFAVQDEPVPVDDGHGVSPTRGRCACPRVRRRLVQLRPWRAPGPDRRFLCGGGRSNRGHCWAFRRGQDHCGAFAHALLGPATRTNHVRRQ